MRITKISAAALAASISFGGAALAFADDVMPADPTIEGETTTTLAEPTTTVADEIEPTTTTVVEDETEGTDGEVDGDKVHPDNHGKTVSEAAHATPPGPGHGKAVSEVARSTNHGHTKGDKAAKPAKPKKAKAPDAGTE